MPEKKERRFITMTEIRASQEGDKKFIEGQAAPFNSLSQDLGGFREVIKPGAFDRSLKDKADVVGLVNHNPDQMFGRSGKNMTLSCDKNGLRFKAEVPNTQVGNDLHENVRMGLLEKCSFGFVARKQSWTNMKDGGYRFAKGDGNDYKNQGTQDKDTMVRELHDVDLMDVSVVANPAYPDTEVNARSKGITAVEIRSFFPDGIPEEVAAHMSEAMQKEIRGPQGTKTKKKAGQELTKDDFAYVGDPDDKSTWKLPIHDKAHAQNALARFGQTQGIPADKKDAVHAKIVAAAKKFGIDVSEEKSLAEAWEKRHDKLPDIKALLPKVQEAMDSLEECIGDLSDAI